MGFLKDDPAGHARTAAEQGRTVLVILLELPTRATVGQLSGVAEQLEQVEAAGWRLHSLAARDAGSMVALFRRSHHQP